MLCKIVKRDKLSQTRCTNQSSEVFMDLEHTPISQNSLAPQYCVSLSSSALTTLTSVALKVSSHRTSRTLASDPLSKLQGGTSVGPALPTKAWLLWNLGNLVTKSTTCPWVPWSFLKQFFCSYAIFEIIIMGKNTDLTAVQMTITDTHKGDKPQKSLLKECSNKAY